MTVYLLAPIFTALAIVFLRPLANALDLIDVPNHRKHHYGDIPLTGGIAVFLSFTFVLVNQGFFEPPSTQNQVFFMCFLFVIFIGVLDDMYDLSVLTRLVGQLLVSLLFVFGTDIYISQLGVLFGSEPVVLSHTVGATLTVLAIMAAMNIFNMIDGMDSVLATVSVTIFSTLAGLFFLAGNDFYFVVSSSLVLIMLAFLMFNILPLAKFRYKAFMGDAGSMLIGLIIIWLLIEGSQGVHGQQAFSPVLALFLIALPLMDMVAIIFRRIYRNTSPFRADHQHIHHILVRSGKSTFKSKVIIPTMSCFGITIGLFLNYNLNNWMFEAFLVLFVTYMLFTNHIIKRIKSNS